jgi:hypothetical protein
MTWLTIPTLGSRRLLTYRRLPDGEVSVAGPRRQREDPNGKYADDLNAFRRRVRITLDPFYKTFSLTKLTVCFSIFKSSTQWENKKSLQYSLDIQGITLCTCFK